MALYRKYRPAAFNEVIGQEHVTEPLIAALDAGRVNHAYMFSGPRGCGKTSSARILARSLNCVEGPTAHPCGQCRSCVSLGPNGNGNLDVVELDAASHGGVDDTRDLRDKAVYAPAESRYRVFIVDEAHMVSNAGFNALLKIVEEPPEHLIFVFATTEPEKVLPTIRSRTHHYPFRLLPPKIMRGLVERVCGEEGVPVEDPVYPLVIRAGGGSPRDTLSVLDQLLAGAGPEGVTYERALALLGVTDAALIDDAVDALAVDDGASLFRTVASVIDAGHDPRRFASDLLDRMRDLIMLRAVPDAGDRGLVDAPGDVLERMREEAERVGPATLTRYAEVIHGSLNDMRGATAPRLLLEVMCARLLLPAAAEDVPAMLQRIEKLEQGVAPAGVPVPVSGPNEVHAGASEGSGDGSAPRFERPSQRAAREQGEREQQPSREQQAQRVRSAQESPQPEPGPEPPEPGPEPPEPGPEPPELEPEPEPAAASEHEPEPEAGGASSRDPRRTGEPNRPDAAAIRTAWSEVHKALRERSNVVAAMFSSAVVKRVDEDAVVLTHSSPALAARLAQPHNAERFREAISAVFGGAWRLVVEKDDGPAPAGGPRQPARGTGEGERREFARPDPGRSGSVRSGDTAGSAVEPSPEDDGPPASAGSEADPGPPPYSHSVSAAPDSASAAPDSAVGASDDAAAEEEMMAEAAAAPGESAPRRDPEEAAIDLLRGSLGATPIDE